jgi:hypothetical protein
MTGNQLKSFLSSIPEDQMKFSVIFVDVSKPDVSYGIDHAGISNSDFITLFSVD